MRKRRLKNLTVWQFILVGRKWGRVMFIKITDNEIVNSDYIAVIRKVYDEMNKCFAIYVNTIGEDYVVLKFDTGEEMEKKWEWLQHNVPR